MPLDAPSIRRLLQLEPLPQEGGYFRETYRAPLVVPASALPDAYDGERNASTAIYFLLTPEEHSALHILPTDEVFHFYLGDPVQMLLLPPAGEAHAPVLGEDLPSGQRPQVVVPGGVWQGCRLVEGGACALLGCTVAPGFDFRDFHVATSDDLALLEERFPEYREEVRRLAPS